MAKFIPKSPDGKSLKKQVVTQERKKVERVRFLKYSLTLNLVLAGIIAYLITNN